MQGVNATGASCEALPLIQVAILTIPILRQVFYFTFTLLCNIFLLSY